MLVVRASLASRVVIGEEAYAVPRKDGRTLLGSTSENVGFNSDTTESGIAEIRLGAARFCPGFRNAKEASRWAGLRPMTPDSLPIIGRDPDEPRLVYACGHSRNGILLGPLTGSVVAALIADENPRQDLAQFAIQRFE
jgi:glycine/D-amino acid oxidase-like deaminating enzyme